MRVFFGLVAYLVSLCASQELVYFGNALVNRTSGHQRQGKPTIFVLGDVPVRRGGTVAAFQAWFSSLHPVRFQLWQLEQGLPNSVGGQFYRLMCDVPYSPTELGVATVILRRVQRESCAILNGVGISVGVLFTQFYSITYSFLGEENPTYPVWAFPKFVRQPPTRFQSRKFESSFHVPNQYSVGVLIDPFFGSGPYDFTQYPNPKNADDSDGTGTTTPVPPTDTPIRPTYPNKTGIVMIGNNVTDRPNFLTNDGNRIYVLRNAQTGEGLVVGWMLYVKHITGRPIRLQVWRRDVSAGSRYLKLVGEKKFTPTGVGAHLIFLDAKDQFNATKGDMLGFANEGDVGQIAYTFSADSTTNIVHSRWIEASYFPAVGETWNFDSVRLPHIFSISLIYDTDFIGGNYSRIIMGPPGEKGPKGFDGPPGAQGPLGAVGPRGSTGPKGALGPPGPAGEAGTEGTMGPIGPPGLRGDRGQPGPQGPTGDPGPEGLKGSSGSAGPTGDTGERGEDIDGPPGKPGPDGLAGELGRVGPEGPRGPTGDPGPQGPVGPPFKRVECPKDVKNTMGCQQDCYYERDRPTCSCKQGYKLASDKTSCIDSDECAQNNGRCQHICENTYGSFKCSCRKGYLLSADGRRCEDANECERENGGCNFAKCVNTPGSHACIGPYTSPDCLQDGLCDQICFPGEPKVCFSKTDATPISKEEEPRPLPSMLTRDWIIILIIWLIVLSILTLAVLIAVLLSKRAGEQG